MEVDPKRSSASLLNSFNLFNPHYNEFYEIEHFSLRNYREINQKVKLSVGFCLVQMQNKINQVVLSHWRLANGDPRGSLCFNRVCIFQNHHPFKIGSSGHGRIRILSSHGFPRCD